MMKIMDVFDFFADDFSYAWKHSLFQGILFLLFGILILFFPQLLVAMIASFFAIIGIIMISSALRMRNYRKRYESFRGDLFDIL
ncbi:MAG: hypothetical protein JW928_03675 [Candidatus Aureabacteria bacterium]|nr:hypothetical protein [Candidatus Auribacterota bacterium]